MTRPASLAIILGAAFGALVTLQPVSDSDLFWHIATGRRTLELALPRVDVFSWTITGAPVLTDQWLGDAILAAARALGDWRGVLALRALAVAALVTLLVDTALTARPRAPSVAALAALPAIALSRFAWTDRPELLGLLCFALLVRLLREGDRGLLLSIPLLFVWAQLHGSYALGLALVLAACTARTITERRDRWRFAPIAAAALVATLITPAGLSTWTSSAGHFFAPPRFVAEEGVPDPRTLAGALFVLVLALVVATATLGRRASLDEIVALVPVSFVALTATRYTPLLAIAAAPYFASRWPDPLARWRRKAVPSSAFVTRAVPAVAALILVIAIGLADANVDQRGYPRAALAALPPGPGLLNEYDWGGYLIEYAPRTPVFIDGRLFPFVPGVLEDYRAIVGAHPGWEDVAARRGVTAMLVRPTDPIAVRAPDRGWRVAYADATAVVLLR
ncbi:MAG TPA: hypothetical protein VEU77_09750 [Candidatus Acidoferrales bacterium]|nr:hypothetical protein [Candidatus Acidoferrales bacterium]